MIGAKLLLNALGGRLARCNNNAGVVDEEVELVGERGDVRRGLANGFLRTQIKGDNLYSRVGVLLHDLGCNLLNASPCP